MDGAGALAADIRWAVLRTGDSHCGFKNDRHCRKQDYEADTGHSFQRPVGLLPYTAYLHHGQHCCFGRRLIATTTGPGSDIGCSIVNRCRIACLDLTLPCGRPNRCRYCWEMHNNGRRWRINTEKRPTGLHCAKEDRAGLVCYLTLIYFVCSDQRNKRRRPTRLDCSWQ